MRGGLNGERSVHTRSALRAPHVGRSVYLSTLSIRKITVIHATPSYTLGYPLPPKTGQKYSGYSNIFYMGTQYNHIRKRDNSFLPIAIIRILRKNNWFEHKRIDSKENVFSQEGGRSVFVFLFRGGRSVGGLHVHDTRVHLDRVFIRSNGCYVRDLNWMNILEVMWHFFPCDESKRAGREPCDRSDVLRSQRPLKLKISRNGSRFLVMAQYLKRYICKHNKQEQAIYMNIFEFL